MGEKKYGFSTTLLKGAGTVGTATLVSRILGFVRDAVIAMLLGAGFYSDAFFVAFRIPNLLRKFFSDGVLSISFVPVFTRYLKEKGKTAAFEMARSAFFIVSLIAALAVIAGIVSAPLIVRVLAPGFGAASSKFALTVVLTKLMMPYVFCLSLTALCMGILNSMGHFAAPAAAPVVLNVTIILFAAVVSPFFDMPVTGLALGVTAGGVLQLALQVPFLASRGISVFKKAALLHPGAVRAGRRLIPGIIGAAGYQINILVSTFMASGLSEGSISYIYYADRLVQFPLALFAVSVSIVLLPELSRKAVSKNSEDASALFAKGIQLVFFITIPAMAGLVALREPVVSLLFQQGAFDYTAVKETASALLFFSVGLWAFSGTRLFVTLFYAFSDVDTPFKAGLAAIAVNLVLSGFLMKSMGHGGLALSISAASMVNFFILVIGARAYLSASLWKDIIICACRSVFISVIMYFTVCFAASFLSVGEATDKLMVCVGVAACVVTGIAVYAGLFGAIKSPEVELIKKMLHRNQ